MRGTSSARTCTGLNSRSQSTGHNGPGPLRAKTAEAAFSTAEALVAILVCGLVFVSLYAGLSTGFAFIQLSRENLRANQILEEKLETIRLYNWDQVNQAGFIPSSFTEAFYPLSTQSTAGLTYTGTVTITDPGFSETYDPDLKQVTVKLTWGTPRLLRQRQMTTLISKYGLQLYIY
jgi:hypothetical protein